VGSNRSSPTVTEDVVSSNHSIVQGDIWGTGNTTERSSVDSQYSWDVSTQHNILSFKLQCNFLMKTTHCKR